MKLSIVGSVLFSLISCSAEKVVSLDANSYPVFLNDPKISLVEFYAPWCRHCKSLAPILEEAAVALGDKARIAKVDCTVNKPICDGEKVEGYPTLKILKNGKYLPYKEKRTKDSIIETLTKMDKPAISKCDQAQLKSLIADNQVAIVGFFDNEQSSLYQALTTVADKMMVEFSFGAAFGKKTAEEHKAKPESIVLFKKFDEGQVKYEGEADATKIEAFIRSASIPFIGELNGETYPKYVSQREIPMCNIFYLEDSEREKYEKAFKQVGAAYKGKMNFVLVNGKLYGEHSKNLNLMKIPGVVIHNLKENLFYPLLSEDQTPAIIEKFLQDYFSGKAEPFFKSAEIPSSNPGPVFTIVRKEFEKLVMDPSVNAFVMIHAPWCGHCKTLGPLFKKTAELFQGVGGLLFGEFDGTANDLPASTKIQVEGFPTVFLKLKSGEFILYSGDRTVDAMKAFLTEKTGLSPKSSSEHSDL